MQDLRAKLGNLYHSRDKERLWSINGRNPIIAHAVQMLQESKNEVMILIGDHDLQDLNNGILDCCRRGVLINVLFSGSNELNWEPADHKNEISIEPQIARQFVWMEMFV